MHTASLNNIKYLILLLPFICNAMSNSTKEALQSRVKERQHAFLKYQNGRFQRWHEVTELASRCAEHSDEASCTLLVNAIRDVYEEQRETHGMIFASTENIVRELIQKKRTLMDCVDQSQRKKLTHEIVKLGETLQKINADNPICLGFESAIQSPLDQCTHPSGDCLDFSFALGSKSFALMMSGKPGFSKFHLLIVAEDMLALVKQYNQASYTSSNNTSKPQDFDFIGMHTQLLKLKLQRYPRWDRLATIDDLNTHFDSRIPQRRLFCDYMKDITAAIQREQDAEPIMKKIFAAIENINQIRSALMTCRKYIQLHPILSIVMLKKRQLEKLEHQERNCRIKMRDLNYAYPIRLGFDDQSDTPLYRCMYGDTDTACNDLKDLISEKNTHKDVAAEGEELLNIIRPLYSYLEQQQIRSRESRL